MGKNNVIIFVKIFGRLPGIYEAFTKSQRGKEGETSKQIKKAVQWENNRIIWTLWQNTEES